MSNLTGIAAAAADIMKELPTDSTLPESLIQMIIAKHCVSDSMFQTQQRLAIKYAGEIKQLTERLDRSEKGHLELCHGYARIQDEIKAACHRATQAHNGQPIDQ